MSPRVETYLDSNASAPLRPEVVEALLSLFEGKGDPCAVLLPNPSSIHSHGRKAKRLVAESREKIARSLGSKVDPEQLVFTSSGSEANQLAIRSILEPRLARGEKPHWITTAVEHDSVVQMIEWVRVRGGSVTVVPVDPQGRLDLAALADAWRAETALVTAVWVGNETGVIAEVEKLSQECRTRGVSLHLDAAQAWGKLPIDLDALGAQLVSFSGHKIGAPAGIGLLWLGRGERAEAVVLGKQEKGRRGGTENLIGIVALGAAAGALDASAWAARVAPLRDRLQNVICERIPGAIIHGLGAPRVANTLNLGFDGVEGDGLVMALDLAGYSVSSGSACSSGALEPSHVLLAMGRTKAQAVSAVRVSLTDEMPWERLEGFVTALEKAVTRARAAATGSFSSSVRTAEAVK